MGLLDRRRLVPVLATLSGTGLDCPIRVTGACKWGTTGEHGVPVARLGIFQERGNAMTPNLSPFSEQHDPVAILNWRRLHSRLTTSGQPSEAQMPSLKVLGITHVVNLGLHAHEKALPDERSTLSALGIAYTHIPVDFSAPTEADFQRFCDVMAESQEERLHAHCIFNARVSAFIYRHAKGGPLEERAAAMMDSIWRPGGTWATFIGRSEDVALLDRYAGRDY